MPCQCKQIVGKGPTFGPRRTRGFPQIGPNLGPERQGDLCNRAGERQGDYDYYDYYYDYDYYDYDYYDYDYYDSYDSYHYYY